jgi:hypothetical protein
MARTSSWSYISRDPNKVADSMQKKVSICSLYNPDPEHTCALPIFKKYFLVTPNTVKEGYT